MADSKIPYHSLQAFADNEGSPVLHGFFGRRGGVSKGVYNALNCGVGSDDEPEVVAQNRALVANTMGAAPEYLVSLFQMHSDVCLTVDKPWSTANRPEADAFVTDVPGLALGILTADCAPVLFYTGGPKPVIGAAHAGWGGAFKGVLESTVKAMEALGAQRETIRACIGPCISKASYEVGPEFYQQFVEHEAENDRFFGAARKKDHFLFDLAAYCASRLHQAGLKRVFIKDLDTYFNEEDFFSYRRATHRGEKDYGRQISAIMIKS